VTNSSDKSIQKRDDSFDNN